VVCRFCRGPTRCWQRIDDDLLLMLVPEMMRGRLAFLSASAISRARGVRSTSPSPRSSPRRERRKAGASGSAHVLLQNRVSRYHRGCMIRSRRKCIEFSADGSRDIERPGLILNGDAKRRCRPIRDAHRGGVFLLVCSALPDGARGRAGRRVRDIFARTRTTSAI